MLVFRSVAHCREIGCSVGGLRRAVNPFMIDINAFVEPRTGWRLHPRSVSDG